jgi:hypothetical protein
MRCLPGVLSNVHDETSTAGGRAAHDEYLAKQSPGGGAGGAWLFIFLAALPLIVGLAISAALSALLLKFVVPVPEGMPPLTFSQRFKASFFATLPVAGVLIFLVLYSGAGLWRNSPLLAPLINVLLSPLIGVAVGIVLQMLAGGLALKLSLPTSFRGFRGYLWASLTSLLVGVVALIYVAGLAKLILLSGHFH